MAGVSLENISTFLLILICSCSQSKVPIGFGLLAGSCLIWPQIYKSLHVYRCCLWKTVGEWVNHNDKFGEKTFFFKVIEIY